MKEKQVEKERPELYLLVRSYDFAKEELKKC